MTYHINVWISLKKGKCLLPPSCTPKGECESVGLGIALSNLHFKKSQQILLLRSQSSEPLCTVKLYGSS